jgi:hypothetical protein
MTNLELKTEAYQIYDMGYGVVILKNEPSLFYDEIENKNVNGYPNVFMQGDDAQNMLSEINLIQKKDVKDSIIDSWLSSYDSVMEMISEKEMSRIGINLNLPKLKMR